MNHFKKFTIHTEVNTGCEVENLSLKENKHIITDPDLTIFKDTSKKIPSVQKNFHFNPLVSFSLGLDAKKEQEIEQVVLKKVSQIKEDIYQETYQKAFKEGYEKGYIEGQKQYKEDLDHSLVQLQKLLDLFESASQKIFEANESFLLALSVKIAEMITKSHLKCNPQSLAKICVDMIRLVNLKESIIVTLSQKDQEGLDILKDLLLSTFQEVKNLKIEFDSQMLSGVIKVKTNFSTLIYDLNDCFQTVMNELVLESS